MPHLLTGGGADGDTSLSINQKQLEDYKGEPLLPFAPLIGHTLHYHW